MSKIKVLNYGHIELLNFIGDDLSIINAARQSYNIKHNELNDKDKNLINYLIKHSHGGPFEVVTFSFNIKLPVFIARQWQRHRISSYSEWSASYSKLKPEFYLPNIKDIRQPRKNHGTSGEIPVPINTAYTTQSRMLEIYTKSYQEYQEMLQDGVAKELARIVLPVAIYTRFTWSVNLRSLFNFISQRSADTAMYEIRCYSKEIEKLIKPIVPISYKAFCDNGRQAP